MHVLKRIAAVFIILTLGTTVILLTNSEIRATASRTIINWFDSFIRFRGSDDLLFNTGEYIPEYKPEGYKLYNTTITGDLTEYIFSCDGKDDIKYSYFPDDSFSSTIDNENITFIIKNKNDIEYYILNAKPGESFTYIKWTVFGISFEIYGTLDWNELFNMAVSVSYQH